MIPKIQHIKLNKIKIQGECKLIFNILTEPWMGVVDKKSGTLHKVGLREYLVNAHLYKCSAENEDFAILRRLQQRLAESVIIDIYGRHVSEDINDELMKVYASGKFSEEKIDDYFKTCIDNGISFDLFDVERPFMQVDKNTAATAFKGASNIVSVASINPRQSSGNNKMFFQHVPVDDYMKAKGGLDKRQSFYDDAYMNSFPGENAYSVTFEEYVNLLLLRHCVAGFGGNGYKCGIACVGKPPVMYQVDEYGPEQSLFSSILLNIVYDESTGTDDGTPLWKWNSYNDAMNSILPNEYKIPLLTGLIFPIMYIRPDYNSIDIKNKTISRIYKAGIPFKIPGTKTDTLEPLRQDWLLNHEPSVATIIRKVNKDESRHVGVSFSIANKEWLNIKTYANVYDKNAAPQVLKHSLYERLVQTTLKLTNEDDADLMDEYEIQVELTAYYISMDKSSYLSQGKYQCFLPNFILNDQLKFGAVSSFIDRIGPDNYQIAGSDKFKIGIANYLKRKIHDINTTLSVVGEQKTEKNKTNLITVEDTLMNRYWRYCENLFKNLFIRDLDSVKKSDYDMPEEYMEALKNIIEKYEKEVFGYANQLIRCIPIPKGKTIVVKKELVKKGEKK